ncbi:MAG: ornithine cyclodeaminase family protein [Dehalogenimonas sp.]|uniref:Putative alanine dehydrogenase n=1 Tax=Candidatus Dehalogenimonas loeffleri TaxID=3127115 RepID=A0ABZ2J7B1_9CHLR|nr:ornithine cyclodeaminase family protein [Dehalogenimonas sp.]
MTTLILTRRDVAHLLTMPETLSAVEGAFSAYASGTALMPPKAYLTLDNGDFRAMPAAVPGAAGMKWINVHLGNSSIGLPSIMGIIIYSDPNTGYPLAIMDGTEITAYRTGAAAAIASRQLAKRDARVLGLIGAGHQADTQIKAHLEYFQFDEIRVFDRSPESAGRLVERFPELPLTVTSLENVCGADIICTLTPSRTPFLKYRWLKPGAHINAIGADASGKQELEFEVLLNARVVVDDVYQATHAGELNMSIAAGTFNESRIYATLGELTAGLKTGRTEDETITVFDSTGLAIQDIACARYIYYKAGQQGAGQAFDLIGV